VSEDEPKTPPDPVEAQQGGPAVDEAVGLDAGSDRRRMRDVLWSKDKRDQLGRRLRSAADSGADRVYHRWRSPVRGPWLTSVFGSILLIGIPVEFVTGLVSYAAYNPRLAGNDQTPHHGVLGFYLFGWLNGPSWIYRLNQGVHVTLGLVLVPVVLAKLWSVIPRLFSWPPAASVAKVLERVSLLLLVGGIVFELVTGILNIGYDYSFGFSFYTGHFFGAWLFMAGFAMHVGLKFKTMWRALRSRRLRTELRIGVADTVAELVDSDLVAVNPGPATISRRGVLALVGGSSVAVFMFTAGQTVGGWTRNVALLAPRGRSYGSGPDDFQVNITATTAGIRSSETDESWRLELVGARTLSLSRTDLLAMPLHTDDLPIACVEGWSTVQRWTGVPLAHLAALAGVPHPVTARVVSLEKHGAFAAVTLAGNQVTAAQSMLALKVNGADLSMDHGYPARTIIPAAPGVHNTKWVRRIEFSPKPAR
jgi:DMSO/TMAO reductase YedYZ molybdopterin-dependent catalytic subunit